MANRYTDSTKWSKSWFCGLTPTYKLFWNYLCDNCNIAGIWSVNWALVKFYICNDQPIDHTILGDRIKILSTDKWFIVGFVEFQQKINNLQELNPNNKAHLGIIRILIKEQILTQQSLSTFKAPSKGLGRPPVIGIGNVIGKVIGNGKGKIQQEDLSILFPYLLNESFKEAYKGYLETRNKLRKPATSKAEKIALTELHKNPVEIAIKMLDQSIMLSWIGIFPIKEEPVVKNALSKPNKIQDQGPPIYHKVSDEDREKLKGLIKQTADSMS